MPDEVSNERLEEIVLRLSAWDAAGNGQVRTEPNGWLNLADLHSIAAEVQHHRARLAQAAEVVDLKGLQMAANAIEDQTERLAAMRGKRTAQDKSYRNLAGRVREIKAALETGVQTVGAALSFLADDMPFDKRVIVLTLAAPDEEVPDA
jgi:hypothetical protein